MNQSLVWRLGICLSLVIPAMLSAEEAKPTRDAVRAPLQLIDEVRSSMPAKAAPSVSEQYARERGYLEVPPQQSPAPQPPLAKATGVDLKNSTVQFGLVQYGQPQPSPVQYAPPGMAPGMPPGMPAVPRGGGPFGPPSQPQRMVRVRVALLEADEDAPAPQVALTTIDELREMIANAKSYEVLDSFDLTTVTDHEAKVQRGRRQPVVTGAQFFSQRGADGRATPARTNQYSQENVGTLLTVTPAMAGDRAVVKLAFERSDISRADDDNDDDEDEEEEKKEAPSAEFQPPVTTTMTVDVCVLLKDGQATILSTRDSRGSRYVLVIGVELLDGPDVAGEGEGEEGLIGGGGFF